MQPSIEEKIKSLVLDYARTQDWTISPSSVVVKRTEDQQKGDLTLLVFPLAKTLGKPVAELGNALATHCASAASEEIENVQVVGGFVNFFIRDSFWIAWMTSLSAGSIGHFPDQEKKIVVEFSSPNTNKPLHLGHLRNNFIGEAVSRILKKVGYDVFKTCVVNDRGVHICKSMLAWEKFGKGETPASTGEKGDHFVGRYYVRFEQALSLQASQIEQRLKQGQPLEVSEAFEQAIRKQQEILAQCSSEESLKTATAKLKEVIRNATPLMNEVREMLVRWEKQDPPTIALWRTMNAWVYEGFAQTYQTIGTQFDHIDYESDCYLLGKNIVRQGVEQQHFYTQADGSVWVDLSAYGLDQKLLLRKDQTSVYITQDLGLVEARYQRLHFDQCIYVVGNEQDYHFNVLKAIAQKMNAPYAEQIYHLSYGMVELPSGKMKSREGTVVDGDDLVREVVVLAKEASQHALKSGAEKTEMPESLHQSIGLGALKFFLLKVHPSKNMVFNPQESIDIQGFTGPFVQYAYARIASMLRQYDGNLEAIPLASFQQYTLHTEEKKLVMQLSLFERILLKAAEEKDPSEIANYVFVLAKKFNSFYNAHSILKAESPLAKDFRVVLSTLTQGVLKQGLQLLGIDAPEKM